MKAGPSVRNALCSSRRFSTFPALRADIPRPAEYASEQQYSRRKVSSTSRPLAILRRTLRFVLIGTLGVTVTGYATFEGVQQYVERVCLAAPSRAGPDDEYGWQDEYQGWTGGRAGGTDPRLSSKARRALRGAWISQQYGVGSGIDSVGATSGTSFLLQHPGEIALKGMIGSQAVPERVDKSLQLTERYLDLAIGEAHSSGVVFPPTLSAARPAGPTTSARGSSAAQADPTAVDLMSLKAAVLERMSTAEGLADAKELYETIFAATHDKVRGLRLAGKVGDICARLGQGDEAVAWWTWGLHEVGLEIPKQETGKRKGWLTSSTPPPAEVPVPVATLPPAELRAAISLLASAESHYAKTAQLNKAAALEDVALRMLPPAHPVPTPTSTTAGAVLHQAWLQQRAALFLLHRASVSYALGTPALDIAASADQRCDTVVSALQPLPSIFTSRSSPLAPIAHDLRRDALLTSAEAAYIHGLLIERSSQTPNLATAAQCFERAMRFSTLESDRKDGEPQSQDWQRYFNAFERVNRKLGIDLEDSTPNKPSQ